MLTCSTRLRTGTDGQLHSGWLRGDYLRTSTGLPVDQSCAGRTRTTVVGNMYSRDMIFAPQIQEMFTVVSAGRVLLVAGAKSVLSKNVSSYS